MKKEPRYKVLFLCTGNSARSILAEYIMGLVSPWDFKAYSAGSEPKGAVNPMTIRVLKEVFRLDASDARSKSWDEFKNNGTEFDFVITVCDHARDTCPTWPGQPIIAHWGSQDPAAVEGTDEEKFNVFRKVGIEIRRRIELFTSLPFEKLDRFRLEQLTKQIGTSQAEEVAKETAAS